MFAPWLLHVNFGGNVSFVHMRPPRFGPTHQLEICYRTAVDWRISWPSPAVREIQQFHLCTRCAPISHICVAFTG